MKERVALQENTELLFTNQAGGRMRFVVTGLVGQGGSCLVYDGYYLNNAGTESTVRIKECYPHKLWLTRGEKGELTPLPKDKERFVEYQDRMWKSFEIAVELRETAGLTNSTSDIFDIYRANGTIYVVSSYAEGCTLEQTCPKTLRDGVRMVLSVAGCLERIHHLGYLYLDLKPENVLVYPETPDMVQLFDFDSVIPMGQGAHLTEYRVSCSKGFAPLEQKQGNLSRMGSFTDVYSVGALLFFVLFGRAPGAGECGFEAAYDYENMRFDGLFQEKVYREFTDFFHHTLQAYAPDRYQDMRDVVSQLERLEKYADLPVPFICSAFVQNQELVVGRQKECERLLHWYESEERVLFVSGMGGF